MTNEPLRDLRFGLLGPEIPVLIGNRRLVGRSIARPFTLVSFDYLDLVHIDIGAEYRCGKPILRGRCRISLTSSESRFFWPVDVGSLEGADVFVGTDLLQPSASIVDVGARSSKRRPPREIHDDIAILPVAARSTPPALRLL